jgi:hypothetical protein
VVSHRGSQASSRLEHPADSHRGNRQGSLQDSRRVNRLGNRLVDLAGLHLVNPLVIRQDNHRGCPLVNLRDSLLVSHRDFLPASRQGSLAENLHVNRQVCQHHAHRVVRLLRQVESLARSQQRSLPISHLVCRLVNRL